MTRLSFNISEKEKSKFASLAASEGLTINQWAKHTVYTAYNKSKQIPCIVKEPLPSKIECSDDVRNQSMDFAQSPVEHFYLYTLNSANNIIGKHMITKGIANSCSVHPREVFIEAIKDRAIAVIVVHNHPSGNTTPSNQDNLITRQLVFSAAILGIQFFDHIIIGPHGNIDSYQSLGLIEQYKTEAKNKLGF